MPRTPRTALRARWTLLALAASLVGASCAGTRHVADPTLLIRTTHGIELGASTDYGVLFLGRTARSGELEIVAWYGDGPSVEASVIEPVGEGLYTAETEIRLPRVRLGFREPRPGEQLLLVGRTEAGRWESSVRVVQDPRVQGLLLEVPRDFPDRADQIGANLFQFSGRRQIPELVGLVSGKILLEGEGGPREYLTVVGPQQLWRMATHRRDLLRPTRWVYREDIL
jgi:hypothetical protein